MTLIMNLNQDQISMESMSLALKVKSGLTVLIGASARALVHERVGPEFSGSFKSAIFSNLHEAQSIVLLRLIAPRT